MEILENPTYFWSLVSVVVVVLGIWLYRRVQRNTADNALFDDMDADYFDADPLLADTETTQVTDEKTSDVAEEPEQIDEKANEEEPQQSNPVEEPAPVKKSRPDPELIIALLVLPNQEEGFLGTDIFTVLQDQDMSYGKMEIFHHYGVGEIKVKHPIFSVANILKPGTFNPKEMEHFHSAGLVFFMQLPGAFGGRVAFELMLNTAKRVAEHLEGTVTDDQQYILDQDMIDGLRNKITQYELEKAET